MPDWEFSQSRPTGGGDYDCGCACCYADENHPEHEADCPIGQAAADLARVTAERDRANREREAENLRAFRLEARLYDLGPTPCPHRSARCLMGPHGVGCECAESDRDRWGSAPFPVRTMQEMEAENARLRHLMLWARDEDAPPTASGDWDAFCEMDAEYNAACGYVPPCHGDEFCCCPQCAVLRGEVPGV